jgi:hypothetical protein
MAKANVMDSIADKIEEMPLTSYEEYKAYNKAAREANKKLKELRYVCKPCPVELHPHVRVKFSRNDQPNNMLPVYLSNHLIHFDMKLYPGQIYDLPQCIVNYLSEKGVPVWKYVEGKDGRRETVKSHNDPRFSLNVIYQE